MHARYLAKHPDAGHDEDERKPEFSEEGRNAARNSVLGGEPLDVDVERHLASLYHRIGPLHPALTRIGVGATKNYSVFDIASARQEDYAASWVLYPPNEANDVWREFGDEEPSPLPEQAGGTAGYPCTIIFYPFGSSVTKARAKMWEKGVRERELECYFSCPEAPAAKVNRNGGAICLIPKQLLKANTAYRVEVECEWEGKPLKKEWSFTTGAKAGPW
jgi:hypothetical protein